MAWQWYAYFVYGSALAQATINTTSMTIEESNAWHEYEWIAIYLPANIYLILIVMTTVILITKKTDRQIDLMMFFLGCCGFLLSIWLWMKKISWLA